MAQSAERLYRIEALIRARGSVSLATLMQELEVSRATLKRDLEYLRSRMGAPIEYDADSKGYRFALRGQVGGRRELPGVWFNEAELHSLLSAQKLLASLDGDGLLSRHLQPLLDRIQQLLGQGADAQAAQALMDRIKVVSPWRRKVPTRFFERVASALLQRQRLRLRYVTRTRGDTRGDMRGEVTERVVSPQRLVHYRNTWYLDAWCHRSQALRRFALDAIEAAEALAEPAHELPLATVQADMDAGYGIYAGSRRHWALLRFDATASRWASREEWHPEQQGRWCEGGCWELRVPYAQANELVMDILRQGEQVEVLAPASLREAVAERLQRAAALYRGDGA